MAQKINEGTKTRLYSSPTIVVADMKEEDIIMTSSPNNYINEDVWGDFDTRRLLF